MEIFSESKERGQAWPGKTNFVLGQSELATVMSLNGFSLGITKIVLI